MVGSILLIGFVMAFGVLTAPSAAEAQSTSKPTRIAVLGVVSPEVDRAFDDGLARLGLAPGRDFIIDRKSVHSGTPQEAAAVASDLLQAKPDIVVAWGTVVAVAVKNTGTSIPVVFLSVGVPVEIGLVASLAHPNGNMTGVTFEAAAETSPKRLQLLKVFVPTMRRVGILYAARDPNVNHALDSLRTFAPALGVLIQPVEVASAADLPRAFSMFKKQHADAIVVVAGAFTFVNGRRIAELALSNRLPSSHAFTQTVAAGGLVSLGPNYGEMARQGAALVTKVIKGAKPADLPVEQPTKFELAINSKTAKALGLTIPPSLLLRADHVIE